MKDNSSIDQGRRNFLTGNWLYTSAINSQCLSTRGVFCQTCKDVCDENAIVFKYLGAGIHKPDILNARCTACMDCVDNCPADAIRIKDSRG